MMALVLLGILGFQEPAVEELVRLLASESIEARDRATSELVRRGQSIIAELQRLRREHPSIEVQHRIHSILSQVNPLWEERLVAVLPPNDGSWSMTGWPDSLFSPDGRRVAHHVRFGSGGDAVMLGDQVGEEFTLLARGMEFSPDSRVLAYEASSPDGQFMVIEGTKLGPYRKLERHSFSPAGHAIAFPALRNSQWVLVQDGQEGPEFDQVEEPVFSLDGKRVAYKATLDKKLFLVCGEQKWGPFEKLTTMTFAPDGRTLAYSMQDQGKAYIVTGDEKVEIPAVSYRLAFAPHGGALAYITGKKEEYLGIGKKTGEPFDRCGFDIVFNPEGTTVAYSGESDHKWFLVAGEKKYGPFDDLCSRPVFPPGSSDPSFVACDNGIRTVWIRGQRKGSLQGSRPHWPVTFSPDATKIAYIQWVDDDLNGRKGWRICAGDSVSEIFDFAGTTLHFSKDGRQLAFGARKGRDLLWKVLDVK
jgi:hypothetical protein